MKNFEVEIAEVQQSDPKSKLGMIYTDLDSLLTVYAPKTIEIADLLSVLLFLSGAKEQHEFELGSTKVTIEGLRPQDRVNKVKIVPLSV